METKILLEKNRSESSVNMEERMNISLESNVKMLPEEDLAKEVSLYDQYLSEKDDSQLYRMIFTVNPICSNVLFNVKTEIVQNEGSTACTRITADTGTGINPPISAVNSSKLTRPQMIRDTEYSHPLLGNYVYHCGIDIFNNHRLRAKGFMQVNKISGTSTASSSVFNTIRDYKRNAEGIIESGMTGISSALTPLHLYGYDTIYSFSDAYTNNLEEKDGWYGFTNATTLNTPNTSASNVTINKVMNNNKPCEFIDMYPDRSLYSFIPKYNKYRNRKEKNWDYCITYPYSCDYAKINTICGGKNGEICAFCTVGRDSAGRVSLKCISQFKHTLKVKDSIMLYYYDANGDFKQYGKVKVTEVGNSDGTDTEHAFAINYDNITDIAGTIVTNGKIFYKKISGGIECNYYFRVFKKIKNGTQELKSDISRVAFAKNIYGDNVAQVVFTDDINVEGLKDNLGRPLTEVYFTVIKRNQGYTAWYYGGVPAGEGIEYSHCFGKLTSGLYMPKVEVNRSLKNYNVRYLNNLSYYGGIIGRTLKLWDSGMTPSNSLIFGTTALEDGITISGTDTFYGDVAEFDLYNVEETIIENVYHRFNTAQRECTQTSNGRVAYDAIEGDDYDASGFKIKTYYLDTRDGNNKNIALWDTGQTTSILGGIMPEGYYYNPHTKVKIRESEENVSETEAQFVNYGVNGYSYTYLDDGNEYADIKMISPVDYGFIKNDTVGFYDKNAQKTYWGVIDTVSGTSLSIMVNTSEVPDVKADPSSSSRCMYAFYPKETVPSYAIMVFPRMKFAWKEVMANSEIPQTSSLSDMPFANGRHYIEQNVNFFVRRQDPHGENHLSVPMSEVGVRHPLKDYIVKGDDPLDLSPYLYVGKITTDTCY